MPKIRGFKPDLWTDEDFVDLSAFARLLWMGMWNYACDNGHLDDKPKQIKMRVLPTDRCNAAELLRELEENGRIRRENGTITIPNFTKHQKPDKRYFQTCDVPGCARPDTDSQPETRGGHVETTTGSRGVPTVVSQGPHVDGEVKGSEGEVKGGAAGTRRDDSTFEAFWETYPRKVARGQARKAWTTAVKKADPDTITTSAASFAQRSTNTDPKFIPHPSTWLNAERWADETDGAPKVDDQGRTVLPPLPGSFWGDR